MSTRPPDQNRADAADYWQRTATSVHKLWRNIGDVTPGLADEKPDTSEELTRVVSHLADLASAVAAYYEREPVDPNRAAHPETGQMGLRERLAALTGGRQ